MAKCGQIIANLRHRKLARDLERPVSALGRIGKLVVFLQALRQSFTEKRGADLGVEHEHQAQPTVHVQPVLAEMREASSPRHALDKTRHSSVPVARYRSRKHVTA